MAVYHLSVKVVSRARGQCVIAAVAYRVGAILSCDRTGSVANYSRRGGVVASMLLAPQSGTVLDRERAWNAADAAEKRRNATLAREYEIALPAELSPEQREALAREFGLHLVSTYGVLVDVAIHEASAHGDQRNHHAHVMASTRRMTGPQSFEEKIRILDDHKTGPKEIAAIREVFAGQCNAALKAAGCDARVDHRSHRARGLIEEPGRKIGISALGHERRTGEVSQRRADIAADAAALADEAQRLRLRAQVLDRLRREARVNVARHIRSRWATSPERADPSRMPPPQRADRVRAKTASLMSSAMVIRGVDRGADATVRPATMAPVSRGPLPILGGAAAAAKSAPGRYDPDAERKAEAAFHAQIAQAMDREAVAAVLADQALCEAQAMASIQRSALSHELTRPTQQPEPIASDRGIERSGGLDPVGNRVVRASSTKTQTTSPASAPATATDPAVVAALTAYRELGRLHRRTRARTEALAVIAGLEVEALERRANDEAVASHADDASAPRPLDPQALAAAPDLMALWTTWADADAVEDRRKRAERREEARQQVVEPGSAVGAATPAVPDPAGDGRQAAPDKQVPWAAEPAAIQTGVGVTGVGVDPRWRDIAIDYALWMLSRHDGVWSEERGRRVAALIGVDVAALIAMARARCVSRYGHDRPRKVEGKAMQMFVVTVTKAATEAGFADLLAVRRDILDQLATTRAAAELARARIVDRTTRPGGKGGRSE